MLILPLALLAMVLQTNAVFAEDVETSSVAQDTIVAPRGPRESQKRLPTEEAAAELFEPFSYSYTGGRYHDEPFYYRMFIPRPLEEGKVYPLIVWLHGLGDGEAGGFKNLGQVMHLDLIFTNFERGDHRFFLLAMQCPSDNPSWFHQTGHPSRRFADRKGDEPLTVLMEILDRIVAEYPVDENRISVIGISSGGNAAWEIAMRYPRRFSAIAPHGSSPPTPTDLSGLLSLPIWAFHSAKDPGGAPDEVRKLVAAIRSAGGTARLTEVDLPVHNCWTTAFTELSLLDWVLAQRRGSPEVNPPEPRIRQWEIAQGILVWEPWHVLVPLAVMFIIAVAVGSEIRGRARLRIRQATWNAEESWRLGVHSSLCRFSWRYDSSCCQFVWLASGSRKG